MSLKPRHGIPFLPANLITTAMAKEESMSCSAVCAMLAEHMPKEQPIRIALALSQWLKPNMAVVNFGPIHPGLRVNGTKRVVVVVHPDSKADALKELAAYDVEVLNGNSR